MGDVVNVWIVDDDPDSVEVIKEALEAKSDRQMTAYCEVIPDIVELFRRLGNRKRPDALVVDVLWPAPEDGLLDPAPGLGLAWTLKEALGDSVPVLGLSVAGRTYSKAAEHVGIGPLLSKGLASGDAIASRILSLVREARERS